jgi:hypothetical protein
MPDEIDWTGWEMTRDASKAPEWLSDDADEDLSAGFSLLRALAADPDSRLIELAPGVWYDPKCRPDPGE